MWRRWRRSRCALRAGRPFLAVSPSKRTRCAGGSAAQGASLRPSVSQRPSAPAPSSPGGGATSPGLGQLQQPPRTGASPGQIPACGSCRVTGGQDRNAVPRRPQSARGPQKPHFNQVFLVPVQGPPRRAAHPSDTPCLPSCSWGPWTRLALQAQVSSATCLLVQGWLGRAAPNGPGQEHSCGPCFQAARAPL